MKAIQKEAETKVIVQSEEEQPNPPDMAAASYFYAVLNDSDIVVEVTSTPFPAPPEYTQYVQINSLDETLIGKKYNRVTGTFEEVSLDIKCDASNVTFKHNPSRSVESKIDEMDALIDPIAFAKHTHSNMEVLNGITSAKVAAWDAGTGGGGSPVDAYTKAESDLKYADRGESYTKAESDAKYAVIGQGGGTGADILPSEILSKLTTVDGNNSGLDADMIDGKHSSDFAKSIHEHAAADITGILPLSKGGTGATTANTALAALGAAAATHTHTGYAQSTHTHTGYAPATHTHSEYAETNHSHYGYASSDHSHSPSSIGAADASHSHDTFNSQTYFKDIINLTEQLRVGNTQMVYCVAGQGTSTISSNNVDTNLAGKRLLSRVPLEVSSDKRLKKNIVKVDAKKLRNFVNNIEVKQYKLKDEGKDAKNRLGVIAQQLIEIDPKIAEYFVSTNKDTGMFAVTYELLVLPLILSVQDLNKRIEELETRV